MSGAGRQGNSSERYKVNPRPMKLKMI